MTKLVLLYIILYNLYFMIIIKYKIQLARKRQLMVPDIT